MYMQIIIIAAFRDGQTLKEPIQKIEIRPGTNGL